MMARALPLDAATYVANELHVDDRMWPETNCYSDVWIEVLHAIGVSPVPALGFVLSADFDGDQWRFFKFPTGDLRALYGIDVFEMNPWMGVEAHVEQQLAAGRLMTVEVDSWYLPDTAGTAYRTAHVKTTIAPNMIDREARRLGYFHNTGYHELTEADYDGVFRHHLGDQPDVLPPYTELVRLDGLRRPEGADLADRAWAITLGHLDRRPVTNPVQAMGKRLIADLDWLAQSDIAVFHDYAFATVRQCGANSELAASHCAWLAEQGRATADAARHFRELSQGMKTAQFKLARLAAGRSVDLTELWAELEASYDAAFDALERAR